MRKWSVYFLLGALLFSSTPVSADQMQAGYEPPGGALPQFQGFIVSLDNRAGRMIIINDLPPEKRVQGEPAEKNLIFEPGEPVMAGIRQGDRVRVDYQVYGYENRLYSITKLPQ
jgi:hypothetical protein